MKNRISQYATLLLVPLLFQLLWSQQDSNIASNYLKHEYRIPMRDGKTLFTSIYTPRHTVSRCPIMLHRTPYGIAPYGEDHYPSELGPSRELSDAGFIFVYQDVRGRMMSEGEYGYVTPVKSNQQANEVDEATDTYDTIEWLIKNIPNNNGNVGMWGVSFPGFYAASGMINAHPALKAVSPQAPITDWFMGDDFHHNGAFFLAHGFGFLSAFGYPRHGFTMEPFRQFNYSTPDGYDFFLKMGPLMNANKKYLKGQIPFWNEIMLHGNYDEFWQSRNLRPHLKGIKPAVMTVGGWFDAENLYGALGVYHAVEESSPDTFNILVMGPWSHGGWMRTDGSELGDIRFGSDTAVFYRKEIEFPFFSYFLKGVGTLSLPEATVFMTGRNEWCRENQWPPQNAGQKNLYFRASGKLSWSPEQAGCSNCFDEYISNPAKPVPYTSETFTGMTRTYMVEDQRFVSNRTDVLSYETDPLDHDITIAGPVAPHLNVSTTGTDSDFIVKLIDVYPDITAEVESDPERVRMSGFQQLVRGEPFRGKFRNSFSNPEPLIPGKITKIQFQMPDVFHTFRKGHRIMIQVQSSWFPLVDRNPQQFIDIYHANPSDFRIATQRIYRSEKDPSYVVLKESGEK
jgi:uncharacterized protein